MTQLNHCGIAVKSVKGPAELIEVLFRVVESGRILKEKDTEFTRIGKGIYTLSEKVDINLTGGLPRFFGSPYFFADLPCMGEFLPDLDGELKSSRGFSRPGLRNPRLRGSVEGCIDLYCAEEDRVVLERVELLAPDFGIENTGPPFGWRSWVGIARGADLDFDRCSRVRRLSFHELRDLNNSNCLNGLNYVSIRSATIYPSQWRRGRDSNSRSTMWTPVFKTGALNRSATPPYRVNSK